VRSGDAGPRALDDQADGVVWHAIMAHAAGGDEPEELLGRSNDGGKRALSLRTLGRPTLANVIEKSAWPWKTLARMGRGPLRPLRKPLRASRDD